MKMDKKNRNTLTIAGCLFLLTMQQYSNAGILDSIKGKLGINKSAAPVTPARPSTPAPTTWQTQNRFNTQLGVQKATTPVIGAQRNNIGSQRSYQPSMNDTQANNLLNMAYSNGNGQSKGYVGDYYQ